MSLKRTETFSQWIETQINRDDPIGDLARDIKEDKNWVNTNDINKMKQYLEKINACDGALKSLESAWTEYIHNRGWATLATFKDAL